MIQLYGLSAEAARLASGCAPRRPRRSRETPPAHARPRPHTTRSRHPGRPALSRPRLPSKAAPAQHTVSFPHSRSYAYGYEFIGVRIILLTCPARSPLYPPSRPAEGDPAALLDEPCPHPARMPRRAPARAGPFHAPAHLPPSLPRAPFRLLRARCVPARSSARARPRAALTDSPRGPRAGSCEAVCLFVNDAANAEVPPPSPPAPPRSRRPCPG